MSELLSIFTNPVSLITFTISIYILFLFFFYFSSVLARRKRKGKTNGDPHTEGVAEQTIPSDARLTCTTQYHAFLDAQNVSAIRDFANNEFYAVQLAALEQSLQQNGYEMTRDKSRETVMPLSVQCDVIRRVTAERIGFLTPRLSEEERDKSIQGSIDDGYADALVMALLGAATAQGWYVATQQSASGERSCVS